MSRNSRASTLACVIAVACGCACHAHRYAHRVIDTETVFVGADAGRDNGEFIVVERLVVEPRGSARVQRIELVWFVDRNANDEPDPGESLRVTESRSDTGRGNAEWAAIELPRGAPVLARIEVSTHSGSTEVATWRAGP